MNTAVLKEQLHSRSMWVFFCIAAVVLLPEYGAVLAAVLAFWLARREAGAPLFGAPLGRAGVLALIYVADIALSAVYSRVRLSTLATLAMWLVMFSVYAALTTLLCDKQRMRRALQVLTLAMGLMGAIACVQYVGCAFLGWDAKALQLWNFLDEWVFTLSPIPLRLYSEGIRVGSTFTNPNIFAEAMLCLMPLSVYCIVTAKSRGARLLFIACLIAGVFGTAFTFSRAAYLCMLGLLFLFALYALPRIRGAQRLFLCICVAVLLLWLVLVPNIFAERLATLNAEDVSVSERTALWSAALEAITEHPLLGYGAGTEPATQIMKAAGLPTVPHAHSLYLQLLVEGGVIAFLLMGAVAVWVLYAQGRYLILQKRQPLLGMCIFAAMCGLLAFGLADFPLLTPKLVGVFWLLLALADSAVAIYKKGENTDA